MKFSDIDMVLARSKRNEKKEERWSAISTEQARYPSDEFKMGCVSPSYNNAMRKWKQEFREVSSCRVAATWLKAPC